jgi:HAD superfamily hydrolase (TIGR01509 family)
MAQEAGQMIKLLLFDLSRTLLFPADKNYKGELNQLHAQLSQKPGYDFSKHFVLNKELLDYLNSIKWKYNLCIFTSGVIQEAPEIELPLSRLFTKILSAEKLGLSKKDPVAYSLIAAEFGILPSEILYVDDSPPNIDAASKAGVQVILYTTSQEIISKITSLQKSPPQEQESRL